MLQKPVGGPLLFNLFVFDLVLFLSNTFLSNCADESDLHITGKQLDIIKEELRKDFKVVTAWLF